MIPNDWSWSWRNWCESPTSHQSKRTTPMGWFFYFGGAAGIRTLATLSRPTRFRARSAVWILPVCMYVQTESRENRQKRSSSQLFSSTRIKTEVRNRRENWREKQLKGKSHNPKKRCSTRDFPIGRSCWTTRFRIRSFIRNLVDNRTIFLTPETWTDSLISEKYPPKRLKTMEFE